MNFLSDSRRCLDLVLFLVAFHLEGHCSLSQSLGAYSVCLLSVGVPVTPHLQAVILEEFEMAPGTLVFLSLSPHLVHRKNHSFLAPTIGGSIITSQALFSTFSSSGPHTRCILGITDSPHLEATDSKLSKWFRGSLPPLG